MAIEDVIGNINFRGFSDAEESRLIEILTGIYNGGSPTATALLERITERTVSKFDITESGAFLGGGTSTAQYRNTIPFNDALIINSTFLNSAYQYYNYVDQNGNIVAMTVERALIHELVHAFEGLTDRRGPDDYAGDTVTRTNAIMRELNGTVGNDDLATDRIAYDSFGYDDGIQYSGAQFGRNLSQNERIDVAIYSDADFDTVNSRSTRDVLFGIGDTDNTLVSGAGRDFLWGERGNDDLRAGRGDDYINGGTGDDVITTGAGDDEVDGGDDVDIVRYDTSYDYRTDPFIFPDQESEVPSGGIFVEWFANSAIVQDAWGDTDTLVNIERIWGTRYDDTFKLSGSFAGIAAGGLTEIDMSRAFAGAGNDNEVLGDLLVLDTTQGVTVDLGEARVTDGVYEISARGFESVVGSNFIDTIYGDDDERGNKIDGRGGKDEIEGKGGNDYLKGGNGWDRIDGGEGGDIIEAGNGGDRTWGGEGDGDDLIFTNAYRNDRSSSGTDRVWGGGGDDVIVGDNGVDIIRGQGGRDLIIGGGGSDTLFGLGGGDYIITEGNDKVNGGKGNDWIDATSNASNATVFFDAEGDNDYIDGVDSGVSQIVFTGLTTEDVRIVWNRELETEKVSEDEEQRTVTLDYIGEAYIQVLATGASINIGTMEGTTYHHQIFRSPDNIEARGPSSGWSRFDLSNNLRLVLGEDTISGSLVDYSYETDGPRGVSVFDDGPFQIDQYVANEFDPDAPVITNADRFFANFDNPFLDNVAAIANGPNISTILTEDAIATLTEDVFALA
ncbi:calcium-binding protein [Yoonia sp. 2307UL14-13]|uniref:calcium-binding protein n=1 Tax=Yoonia sp. 2307UL14-13 TaxID=3126506 RepID=UPI00309C8ACA